MLCTVVKIISGGLCKSKIYYLGVGLLSRPFFVFKMKKERKSMFDLRSLWHTIRDSLLSSLPINSGCPLFTLREICCTNFPLIRVPFNSYKQKSQAEKSTWDILAHHKGLEPLTFASVGASKLCFLSPWVRTILIVVYL